MSRKVTKINSSGACTGVFDGQTLSGTGPVATGECDFYYTDPVTGSSYYLYKNLSGNVVVVRKTSVENVGDRIITTTLINEDQSTETTFASVSYERKEVLISCSMKHPNDDCSDAATVNVTNTRTSAGSYDFNFASSSNANCDGDEIWLKTTVPSSGNLTIETSSSIQAGVALSVFSGTCINSLSPIVNCQDLNNGTSNGQEKLEITGRTAGEELYIAISNQDNKGSIDVFLYDLPSVGVSDPCNCDDPLNIRSNQLNNPIALFHDSLTFTGTGAILCTSNCDVFRTKDGSIITDFGTAPNRVEFYRVPGDYSASTFSIGSGAATLEAGTCIDTCGPEPIPTMSQWGLLIFGLLILNMGVVFVQRKDLGISN